MNRNARAFFATLMIGLLLLPVIASAGWRTKEIGWHISRIGGINGTSIVQVDTALTVLNGASVLDTSVVFTLDDADVPPRGLAAQSEVLGGPGVWGSAYQSDTTVVGFLVVQVDSTAAAVGNGTFTVHLEGRVGGYGATSANSSGWARIDSTVTTLGAVADQSLPIAIKTRGLYNSPLAFSQLRARTSGGTGTMGSVRLFLRWWKNDASNEHRP